MSACAVPTAPSSAKGKGVTRVASMTACLASTDGGDVVGTIAGNECTYLGIPYAAPPVGALRWRPTQQPSAWDGVRDATAFGNMCPQPSGTAVVGNEDCLNLNVFAPATQPDPRLPVMVYLHGGGNKMGSNADAALDGRYLAEHGSVVVVAINFRLGALGWLTHAALDAESDSGTSGNYGLLDQIAALKWVQRNAAAFGGDPTQVALFGQSAGAGDVAALIASPLAQGLFSRAIVQSGGFAFEQSSLAADEAAFGGPAVTKLGCDSADDVPACLRALHAATIVTLAPGAAGLSGKANRPVVDGFVLPTTTLDAARSGALLPVPIMIGNMTQESSHPGQIPVGAIPDAASFPPAVYALFGKAVGDQALALYPLSDYATPRNAFVALTTDWKWGCPVRRFARAASQTGQSVFRYADSHVLTSDKGAFFGAFHTQDLMFVFRVWSSFTTGPYAPTDDDLALSDAMIGYWSRFARNGDPNSEDAPEWAPYGECHDPYLQLDTPIASGRGFHDDLCDFWDAQATTP